LQGSLVYAIASISSLKIRKNIYKLKKHQYITGIPSRSPWIEALIGFAGLD
jgi:hypothetical protein